MARINEFVPPFYEGIYEFEQIAAAENKLFEKAEEQMNGIINNQFVQTCDAAGILQYEIMLGIVADPNAESLQFRKDRVLNRLGTRPPFTLAFLRNRLDSIIGKGRYSVYVDYDKFTLYVESVSPEQRWYNELLVTINSIKPANIIFINKPVVAEAIKISETVVRQETQFLRLGFWSLGITPFRSDGREEVIKMPEARSISETLLEKLAEDAAAKINKVKINDQKEISVFTKKETSGSTVVLEYTVPKYEDVSTITNIKVLSAEEEVLSSMNIYVPLQAETVMKHTINIKEGV